jgi:hypothetical protein
MKKVLIFAVMLVLSVPMFGQCLSVINGSKSRPFPPDKYNTYGYLEGTFDVNNAFNVFKSNSEPWGLDFDGEIGYRKGYWVVYGYYGEYRKINYFNFGAGVDYIFLESRIFDIATGINFGAVNARDEISRFAYAVRIKPALDINDVISIVGRLQYQQRPDRWDKNYKVHGLIEFSAGLQFKFY